MDLTKRSKKLSYLLRHSPQDADLTLDSQGWCSVEQLLDHTDFTLQEIRQIVESDEKQRYTLDEEKQRIRANQGHSVSDVKINFSAKVPPVRLYHGTSAKVADSIMRDGLLKMNRHHVHLSADFHTAHSVAARRTGMIVIFEVNAKAMLADGCKFYQSDNGVWLVDYVAPKYLTEL